MAFNGGSCIRLCPKLRYQLYIYVLVMDQAHDGSSIKILTLIDKFSRHRLALVVDCSIKKCDLFITLGKLLFI